MFTKGQASMIKSLHDKKYRQNSGLFLVEGEKSVAETLNSNFEIKTLLATKSFYTKYSKLIKDKKIICEIVEPGEIENVSTLESNDSALAIVKQKAPEILGSEIAENEIVLALDNIRDPGNFGTIIRIADWYGIKKVIASIGTVDLYNPKVISATKGSFTRVNIYYADLKNYLGETKAPILGAFMTGENVHKFTFPKKGILVMGNESNGISKEIESLIKQKVTIPAVAKSYGEAKPSFGSQAESLNVAIATAVLIDNWKRNLN
jgi:RNA methyltransferase, TrmH family